MANDQRARFTETARAVGADDDEAAFRAKLATVARHKPKGEVPAAPPEPPGLVPGKRRRPATDHAE